MCFPFSNSVEKKTLISEYRNNLFLILLIIFVLPGKFEFDLGEISNFLCFISLKFHFSLAVCPNSQQVRYSILRSLLVSRNISSSNLSDLSESLFQYNFFFFLQSFHCLCNNWIAIYFNYNVCLCYHSIKQCIKTPQI